MKRLLLYTLFIYSACLADAQGIPFLRNYFAEDYHAHSRNFDIAVSNDGIVFVANFEGLLYYDHAQWRIIHTPEITRVTVVYCDQNNTIWVAGYNFFGQVRTKENGELYLQRVAKRNAFKGEVQEIWESNGKLHFMVNDGNMYVVNGDGVALEKVISKNPLKVGLSDVINTESLEKDGDVVVLEDVTQTEPLDNGLSAVVKRGRGITIVDDKDGELYSVTESNGLCTNSVGYVGYTGRGQLWGATDNGVFCMSVPSPFSHFTSHEGLPGEVLAIASYGGKKYVGTSEGLFHQEGGAFVRVSGINHGCWDIEKTLYGLLVATANGVYRILPTGGAVQLTSMSSMALLADGNQFYSGEMDGVFLRNAMDNKSTLVCGLEKVSKIIKDKDGAIWLQNLYGEIWRKMATEPSFKPYLKSASESSASTLVVLDGRVEVINTETETPITYPQFSYTDDLGIAWLTDDESKSLYAWKDNKRQTQFDWLLFPFRDLAVRSMLVEGDEIWIGGDKGLTVINTKEKDPVAQAKSRLLIRSVTLGSDSILWGGFGTMPKRLPNLGSDDRNLRFTFSLDYTPVVGTVLYRYRLNDGSWSAWSDENDAEFFNLAHGAYTLYVQAQLTTGELSEPTTIDFSIAYPFYMRWYMMVLYLILAVLLVMAFFRYRLHRLKLQTLKLEAIVQERTAEVVRQKDEIEEKSKSLESALRELHEAQGELIRQEKMATVGKLTQGLIDRILNPLNYINNFSKLSEGLVKDIEANIEDEKDNMDSENYEDTMEVLDMLTGNLQKVGEHGMNTSRTLKAMEEMLKDRSGGIVPMEICALLRQDEEMLRTYYADDIAKHHIKITFEGLDQPVNINGNAEQLSKTFMSILGNSVYAVEKKSQRDSYTPEIGVRLTLSGDKVLITIRDNGVGIEDTIINKIFDPFFTTKPTGVASGVGLYLSREIVQNHGGDIAVKSIKNEYSEFTITLPTPNA